MPSTADLPIPAARGHMTDAEAIRRFILAGRALFTLANELTGNRQTFKVRRPSEKHPHFVSARVGAEYQYLGTIFDSSKFRLTRKSPPDTDRSVRAFNWLWVRLGRGIAPEEPMRFYHEGRCCVCGRELTDPESIAAGIGPVCAGKVGAR